MARGVRLGTLAAGPHPADPPPHLRAAARAHPPLTTHLWLKNPRNPRKFLPLQCS